MRIIKCDDRKAWDGFIAAAPECPILQTFEWAEVKGWEPIRIAVKEDDSIVAAASILKRKIPYLTKSIFYCPNGPVLNFKDKDLLDFLLRGIKEEAGKQNSIVLKIDPMITEEDRLTSGILLESGFRPQKKQIQPRTTYYIDLSQSLDSILKNCEEKTRYNIRLSSKKGVDVKEASNTQGIDAFYRIYQETSSRDNFLIHPKEYYLKIKRHLIDRGMAKVFIAYHEKQPIAGVFIFMFGRRVWYMYGASLSNKRNVMPNHALHWHVIKWAKESGYKIYDLWGIPSNPNPSHPLWGVYRFKKGFRGKLIKYIGVQDLVYDPVFYNLFNKGLSFFQNARSLLTKGKISDSLEE